MRRAPSSATRRAALGVMPARGGSSTTTSGCRQAVGDQIARRLAGVGADELHVRDAVGERVLSRTLDRLGDDLDANHASRGAGQREPDRARAAVQVPDRLAAGQPGLLDRVAIEHVGHLAVGLQERARRDAQAQAADLLLEPRPPEQRPGRDAGRDLGDAIVDGVQDAHDPGRALLEQRLQALHSGRIARDGDEDAQHLTRAHALAHDEVPEVAGVRALVVGLQPLARAPSRERPRARRCRTRR